MKLQQSERRKNVDKWVYISRGLAISGWILFLIALIISYYAAPKVDYGVVRYYGLEIRKFWLTPLTGYLYVALWISAFNSYLCLIIARYRSRRAEDNSQFNYVLLFIICVVWVIYLLIKV